MDTDKLVDLIHKTPTKTVVVIAGGGGEVFKILLHRGGGSSTLISGIVPYSSASTVELLGGKPDKFVSEQTARGLAMAAYQKALKLRDTECPVVGIAVTCSLQGVPTEREGRVHNVYAALQTPTKTITLQYTFEKVDPLHVTAEHRREYEESCVADIVINLLAEGCGLSERVDTFVLLGEPTRKEAQSQVLADLLAGKLQRAAFKGKSHFALMSDPDCVLPGSFNPIHEGHQEMVEAVEKNKKEGFRCDFELSIFNVDKPALDFLTIFERLENFEKIDKAHVVWLTTAPTFYQKSELFKDTKFAVGYDTAIRILDPKYGKVEDVLNRFKKNGNYFYMFPRELKNVGLTWSAEEHLKDLPGEFVLDEMKYRHVSSTNIRQGKNDGTTERS